MSKSLNLLIIEGSEKYINILRIKFKIRLQNGFGLIVPQLGILSEKFMLEFPGRSPNFVLFKLQSFNILFTFLKNAVKN